MPTKLAVTPKSVYQKLVTDIGALYLSTRKAMAESYWKMGQRIIEVEQNGEIKTKYGTALLADLSRDLSKRFGTGFSERNLRRMRQFYLSAPIRPPAAELSLSGHLELLSVRDEKKRDALKKRIETKGLNRAELRKLLRKEISSTSKNKTRAAKPFKSLTPPEDLRLYTYLKSETSTQEAAVLIDCGFYVYRNVTKAELKRVTLTDKPAYVYSAVVERVIDGDTLWAVIDLGFGTRIREKLRLRGLDSPELKTVKGEEAKRFVAKLLKVDAPILIKSTKNDLYGRFVADVFFTDENQNQIYLNQLLLEKGFAVRAY